MKIPAQSYKLSVPERSGTNTSRRQFIKRSSAFVASGCIIAPLPIHAFTDKIPTTTLSRVAKSALGFNGERIDSATGLYHLGNGYRAYSPSLMRFHSADSMSPFGRGGINKYAYCLGDPINKRDPSGHFAIMSILIGAIIGAVVGAGVSAAAEGVRAAATGDSFDGKQVAIGAILGFISGGFGAAGAGLKTGVQFGLAVADTVISGAADFSINLALGSPPKSAGINAGIGAAIGLLSFGSGLGISKVSTMARQKWTGMGGVMKNTSIMDEGIFYYRDTYKKGNRLNISSHGEMDGDGSRLVFGSGTKKKYMSANELARSIKSRVDLSEFNSIRLISCYSGSGSNPFGKQLSDALGGMRVKAFIGQVTADHRPDIYTPILRSLQENNITEDVTHNIAKTNPYWLISDPVSWWNYGYKPIYFGK
ncbi:RHS repeat-associated core domain-containing protein [Vibrio coralliilyticus]|nr:RHS repeat-associated core domain-containing protein [Vibrio coralliilyticus]